jgi:hypothetical protein
MIVVIYVVVVVDVVVDNYDILHELSLLDFICEKFH